MHTDLAGGLLGQRVTVPDTNGYAPVSADITVARSPQTVLVTGRIIDSTTRKGIRGDVHLGILADNSFALARPELLDYVASVSTAEDGTFKIMTIPGPMLLMGGVDHEWTPTGEMIRSFKYKSATPDAKYPQYFPADHPRSYMTVGGGFSFLQGNFCRVLRIEPGTAVVKKDIIVEPASAITVRIQDAQGHPLLRTFVEEAGRVSMLGGPILTETDSWLVHGLGESGKPRRLIFYERSNKLFATLLLKSDEKGSVVARLRPCGAVRGKVVDKDGNPVSGINVNLTYPDGDTWGMHAFIHGAKPVVTDTGGRFVIDEVIPGIDFYLWARPAKGGQIWEMLVKKSKVETGRTTDLGEVRLLPAHSDDGE